MQVIIFRLIYTPCISAKVSASAAHEKMSLRTGHGNLIGVGVTTPHASDVDLRADVAIGMKLINHCVPSFTTGITSVSNSSPIWLLMRHNTAYVSVGDKRKSQLVFVRFNSNKLHMFVIVRTLCQFSLHQSYELISLYNHV